MAEEKNVLGMSDEDFLKENPPEVKEEDSTEDTSNEEDKTKEESSEETTQESEESKEDNKTEEEDHDKEDDQSQSTENEEEDNSDNTKTQDTDTKTTEPEKKSIKSSGSVDYEAFYKKVMAPFKANGKMITLRSPEEAIQLMQQGANFTKKMQAIAPHRKLLIMLENNGLLDESKINN